MRRLHKDGDWSGQVHLDVPAIGLCDFVLLPGMRCSVFAGGEGVYEVLRKAAESPDRPLIAVFSARRGTEPPPRPEDLCRVGTVARIVDVDGELFSDEWMVEMHGAFRVRAIDFSNKLSVLRVRCVSLRNQDENAAMLYSLADAIRGVIGLKQDLDPAWRGADQVRKAISQIENIGDYPGAVIDLLDHLSVEARQTILETDCLSERLAVTLEELYKGLSCAE